MALPLALSLAQNRIDSLFNCMFVLYADDRTHKMRSERIESLKIVLRELLNAACLQHDGIFLSVFNGQGRALTVGDIAARTKFTEKKVKRCLHDLRACGLLHSEEQFKRQTRFGQFLVSPVLRSFTKLFWQSLHLWELFIKSVKKAQQGKKIRLKRPVYEKNFAKCSTPEQAKNIFMCALECKSTYGEHCTGGHMSENICILCKKLLS